MKAHYRTRNGRIVFEVQGETQKSLFKQIAQLQDVFEADERCGCCQSENIKLIVRSHDDNEFYEMGCCECRAVLQFGQHKRGETLFPRRYDDQRQIIGDNGWRKFRAGITESRPA